MKTFWVQENNGAPRKRMLKELMWKAIGVIVTIQNAEKRAKMLKTAELLLKLKHLVEGYRVYFRSNMIRRLSTNALTTKIPKVKPFMTLDNIFVFWTFFQWFLQIDYGAVLKPVETGNI